MTQLTLKKCWNCHSDVVITSWICPFCKEGLGLVGPDGIATKNPSKQDYNSGSPFRLGCGTILALGLMGVLLTLIATLGVVTAYTNWQTADQRKLDLAEAEKAKAAADKAAVARQAELARIEAAKTPEQRAAEAEAKQKAVVAAAEIQRRAAVERARGEIVIPMGFPDNFTVGLSMVALKTQMFNQLKALQAAGRLGTTSGVTFEVTAKMMDQHGNSNTDALMTLRFRGDDLRQVNWENMDDWRIMGLCQAQARTTEAEDILVEFSQTSTIRAFAPGFARQIR